MSESVREGVTDCVFLSLSLCECVSVRMRVCVG